MKDTVINMMSYGWEPQRLAKKLKKTLVMLLVLGFAQLMLGATYELDCNIGNAASCGEKLTVGDTLVLKLADGRRFNLELVEKSPSKIGGEAFSPGPQLFTYSSGYYFTANGKSYHTIMAYDSDGNSDAHHEEVPCFSSPLHTYNGVVVGDSIHDNTLPIKNTFGHIADFRAEKSVPNIVPDPELELKPLTWYTTKAEAFAAAQTSGKRILLVYGRDECSNTTATRNYTCEALEVKAVLQTGYVLWYSNCDTQSMESYGYLKNFKGTLPGVSVIDTTLDRAVVGAGGYQDVPNMLALLATAEFYVPSEPPVNDMFAKAMMLIGESGSVTATNAWATSEPGELLSYSAGATVWWKWTAPANGSVVFDTAGSPLDTVMGVYKGRTLSSLTQVAYDDDGGDTLENRCTFECSADMTYYVCVGGMYGAYGEFSLNWEFTEREIEVDPTPVDPIVEQRVLYRAITSGGNWTMPYATAAGVYDGYLRDADGNVTGTIQVKVAKGKVDKKTGAFSAKVTATVVPADGSKKIGFKGGLAHENGNVTGLTADGHALNVALGADGLDGLLDGKSIDGARNFFAAKDASAKTLAAVAERAWVGAVNVVADGVVLTVSIAKKGKVKITGMVNGAKVSANSQLLVGEAFCCIPVVITKKAKLAFNLWLMSDGSVEVAGLDGALAAKAGALKTGAKFTLGEGDVLPGVFEEYLPNGLAVAANGTKWVVAGGAKAGKPKLVKGSSEIDSEKSKFTGNMSGLKLSYKAKDGSFKGSFKAYAIENGKLKSYSVTVIGVMVGDVGYGTATIEKPVVSWPVTIE